ncbi:MAG: DNA primase [Sulfobacillus thermotolerans]|uniref:DNA primase n=1 Tax=Sulfobacillus thermotolerans TaxID=338644 RepID=A0ABM6RPA4_9FIRM|nr:DNA primase [Sulfobacillus thermotolerans]MCY0906874.1 DNA primase [Sulfobacillus thermotolerans]
MSDPEYDTWVASVREAADIVEVIGRQVTLKRKGKHYWGLCPFHQEQTPSFSVDAEQQLFYCFGCHVGGTVFTFLMQHGGMSFSEAVDMLATENGIPKPHRSQRDHARSQKMSRLQAIMEWSQEFFRASAQSSVRIYDGYLQQRQVDEATRERFALGYAPDSWTALRDFLMKHGIAEEEMLEAGVVVARREGRGVYDRWRHRIIFPIWNHRGQIIAFGGRAILPEQEPKYLNSPETPLFHKGQVLYGEHLARPLWRQGRRPLLVEGNFDVIACHQAGLGQAVASLGTALTEDHARSLSRHAKEVDLLYDRDTAGEEAMRRAFLILSAQGLQVNRVQLDAGKDPDEFLREKGALSLAEKVEERIPYFEAVFKDRLSRLPSLTARGKAELVDELKPLWKALTNPVEQAGYLEMVSRTLRLDQSILAQSFGVAQGFRHTSPKNRHNMERNVSKGARPSLDVYLLALLLRHPEHVALVREELPDWIEKYHLSDIVTHIEMGQSPAELSSLIDTMDPGLRSLLLEAITFDGPDGGIRVIKDTIKVIRRREDYRHWQSLIERLRQGENTEALREEIRMVQGRLAQGQNTGMGTPFPFAGIIGKEG